MHIYKYIRLFVIQTKIIIVHVRLFIKISGNFKMKKIYKSAIKSFCNAFIRYFYIFVKHAKLYLLIHRTDAPCELKLITLKMLISGLIIKKFPLYLKIIDGINGRKKSKLIIIPAIFAS